MRNSPKCLLARRKLEAGGDAFPRFDLRQFGGELAFGDLGIFSLYRHRHPDDAPCVATTPNSNLHPQLCPEAHVGNRIERHVPHPSSTKYSNEYGWRESGRLARLDREAKMLPTDVHRRRQALSGYREESWMRNVPLYAMTNMALWG